MMSCTSSSLKRSSSVFNAGAFQFTRRRPWPPSPSGSYVVGATPPTPSAPWHVAHCSDCAALKPSWPWAANNVRPRSTERSSKYSSDELERSGSRSQYSGNATAVTAANNNAQPSSRSSRRPSRSSSSRNGSRFSGGLSSGDLRNVTHAYAIPPMITIALRMMSQMRTLTRAYSATKGS
jgi:hypothetical protein